MGKLRKSLKCLMLRVLLLMLSLVVALLLAEGVLRLLTGSPEPVAEANKLYRYDKVQGWRKVPLARGWHTTREYSVQESINSRGIRGPEIPYEKPAGEYRILVLGDSFAEGFCVKFDKIFSELLKKRLNKIASGRRIEVINAGTCGYSTDQELLEYRREGRKYHPDLTILMFCYNDVWYNIQPQSYARNAGKCLFKLQDDKLVLTNVPVPRTTEANPHNEQRGVSGSIKQLLTEHSRLYELVRDTVNQNLFLRKWSYKLGIKKIPADLRLNSDKPWLAVPPIFQCWNPDPSPDVRRAWQMTEALLKQLKKETAADGSRLLVFNVPSSADIYDKICRDTRRQYGIPPEWTPRQIDIELAKVCARNKIDFIDPYEQMHVAAKKLQQKSKTLYFIKDGHWNELGHDLAAGILCEYITQQNWLNILPKS